jgi:peptidoglycan/xylan/chitin deacetylase (PgdA/CDA1 family)
MSTARSTLKVTSAVVDVLRRPSPGLVVLLYHRVGRWTTIEVDLPTAMFEEQIAFLAANATVVTLADGLTRLADRTGPEAPMVAITFDDGTADFTEVALPVLVEHGVPVTLYVATDFVERGLSFPNHGLPLSWAALRDAATTGFVDVGSHTDRHLLLDRIARTEVGGELDRSIELIGKNVGVAPRHFAYPKAVMGTPAADAAVRARFESAALAGTRVNPYGTTDRYRLARSPIQVSDGMRWFKRKVAGGMSFEDTLRQKLNRRRYAGATT